MGGTKKQVRLTIKTAGNYMTKSRLKRKLYLLTSNSTKFFIEIILRTIWWNEQLFYRMKNNLSVELIILKAIMKGTKKYGWQWWIICDKRVRVAFTIHNSSTQEWEALVAQKSASTSQGTCRSRNEPMNQFMTASQISCERKCKCKSYLLWYLSEVSRISVALSWLLIVFNSPVEKFIHGLELF